MKNGIICTILICAFLFSCIDNKTEWVLYKSQRISVYSRPNGFNVGVIHSAGEIASVIDEQDGYIKKFEKTFGVKYDGIIKIYLYNTEETNVDVPAGGGYALPVKSEIHSRFLKRYLGTNGRSEVLGGHEIFHVLEGQVLGIPKSRLISEGGASWFDGGYSGEFINGIIQRKSILKWMSEYYKHNSILSISSLVSDSWSISEEVFYPQAGFAVKWIIETIGINKYIELLRVYNSITLPDSILKDIYGKTSKELDEIGKTTKYSSFDEWSNAEYGKEKTILYNKRKGEYLETVLATVLGKPIIEIDSEYLKWVKSKVGN